MRLKTTYAILTACLLLGCGTRCLAQEPFDDRVRIVETSVLTNLTDWVASAKANAGFQISLKRRLSVEVGAKYLLDHDATSSYGKDYDLFVSAGARWWPWNCFSGGFLGTGVAYEKFFNEWFVTESHRDYTGAYLKAGYDLMLLRHLNLEVGGVVWGGMCRRTDVNDGGFDVDRSWFGRLAEVTIGLVYIF